MLLRRPDVLQACKQCVEKGMPCSFIPETEKKSVFPEKKKIMLMQSGM